MRASVYDRLLPKSCGCALIILRRHCRKFDSGDHAHNMEPQWMRSDVHRAPYGSGLGEIRGLIFLRGGQMKIASLEDPFPYGTCMTGHRSATERSRALPKNVRFAVAMSTCAIGLDRSAIAAPGVRSGATDKVPCSARLRLTTAHQINPPVNDSV
jgi:hypothetical protein